MSSSRNEGATSMTETQKTAESPTPTEEVGAAWLAERSLANRLANTLVNHAKDVKHPEVAFVLDQWEAARWTDE